MILNQLLKHTTWWVSSGLPMPLQLFLQLELLSHRWAHASFLPCKKTLWRVFSTLSNSVQLSLKMLEESVSQFTILELLIVTLEEPMDIQVGWFQCSGYSMILHDIAIKVVAGEREHLPSTSSHGIMIRWISFNFERIMAKKSRGPEICSMLFGFQTSLWRESKITGTGPSCAPMNAQVFQTAGVRNSKSSMKNTRERAKAEKRSKLKLYGARLLIAR